MSELMTHPKTRFPVRTEDYLTEEVEGARERLVKAEQALHDYHNPAPAVPARVDPDFTKKLNYWRRNGPPQLSLHDETDSFKSMADGKRYTSKKKYRTDLKAREYEEVGDEREAVDKIGEFDEAGYDRQLEQDVHKAMGEH